jgi:hypothetical protein
MKLSAYIIIILIFFTNFKFSAQESTQGSIGASRNPYNLASKPYTRYWWFASKISKQDVKWNLDWLKENGFGGVEIAWVYPINRNSKTDTVYMPRYEWLSPEWQDVVDYTIKYADTIGLGCDLTFGTLWPFGDSYVKFEEATQKFDDPKWRQKITASWQYPKEGYVIDHLTAKNYKPYFNRLMEKFPHPKTNKQSAYFIDSWEVETEKLWSDGFANDFRKKFDYDITEFMDSIYSPKNSHYLYDYMSLISEKVLKFYKDYDSTLNSKDILSRGQVSGAPCDLISGYSILDIPEGESMLFEPEFCAIPASAALLSGKPVVTSETFTCLYGWPRDFLRQEQVADLKLVADALFANGINHIIWHGKPHNYAGSDLINFYASTHIGYSGNLGDDILPFNKYLEKVSSYLKKGHTYSQAAVYLPTEDAWIAGVMPKEKQFKWAWGFYEMRYVYFPDELTAFSPVWINGEFLEKSKVVDNKLVVGESIFDFLYIDSKYLDYKVVNRLVDLAKSGLKIIIKQQPQNPNAKPLKNDYSKKIEKLFSQKNVISSIPIEFSKLIDGKNIPKYWSRIDGKDLYIYFSNPKSYWLKFPLEYGQSLNDTVAINEITINFAGKTFPLSLKFNPYQSLLYKISNDKIEQIDIEFVPKIPVVKKRNDDYQAPWMVK